MSPTLPAVCFDDLVGADGHYFDPAPDVRSRREQIHVAVRGDAFDLVTDRGVFSPRRLDPGTGFLLDAAPAPPPTGTFLDLGCGYGPIALALARWSPGADVVAVDVNERSRDLCAENAAALGAANVRVAAPDDVEDTVRFDLIWSNPPIRIGKDALHALLERWLGRLAPGGRAVLVVGRNLGADSLQRWLTDRGLATERLASKRGYRLLAVAARTEGAPEPD